ncbi:hypothetical protein Dsin_001314 [Dipteronia sinensis]|uniref:Cytochrome P450 n=1 Tax=Dipteronia sinensis TaxID=43782 RepID=A0AAE0EI86_9ROSI|nr:hypothetical protein Dsin_001314 [Dipteronia sinensis]
MAHPEMQPHCRNSSSFSCKILLACTQALQNLLELLKSQPRYGDPVHVMDHFLHSMFSLLALMCFGDKLEENQIKDTMTALRRVLMSFAPTSLLNICPTFTRIIFRKQWEELLQARELLEDVLIPLIRQRKKLKEEKLSKGQQEQHKDGYILSYVDTLLDLQLSEKKGNLDEKEIVDLCSEFLNGGTDSTSTALQWIMANLVKYPHIQEKLFLEIKEVMGDSEDMIKEDDLQKMSYLKAVVLERLRRHSLGKFSFPHAVLEDVVLDGYVVPKNGTVNFMIGQMAMDPKVWENPMAFVPERFLINDGKVFDITGSGEIKMMPFGAGRRICPGLGLAMLNLEYFVANLVWFFEWKIVDRVDVDLEEKHEFTVVMKNPLLAHVCPRLTRI